MCIRDRYYATAKKATVSTTFDEETCKGLIGTQMPGKISKIKTEPYAYTCLLYTSRCV